MSIIKRNGQVKIIVGDGDLSIISGIPGVACSTANDKQKFVALMLNKLKRGLPQTKEDLVNSEITIYFLDESCVDKAIEHLQKVKRVMRETMPNEGSSNKEDKII